MSKTKTLKQSVEDLKKSVDRNIELRKELKEITDKCLQTIDDIEKLEEVKQRIKDE